MRSLAVTLTCGLLLAGCGQDRLSKEAALEIIQKNVGTGYNKSIDLRFGTIRINANSNSSIYGIGSRGRIVAGLVDAGFAAATKGKLETTASGQAVQEWRVLPTEKLQRYITKRRVQGAHGATATVQLLSDPFQLTIDAIDYERGSAVVNYSYTVKVTEVGVVARKAGGFRWSPDQQVSKWRAEFIKTPDGAWRKFGIPRRVRS